MLTFFVSWTWSRREYREKSQVKVGDRQEAKKRGQGAMFPDAMFT